MLGSVSFRWNFKRTHGRTLQTPSLKQVMNGSAFRKQIERPAFPVDGFQVVDSHGEIHRLGDVLGSDGAVRREGRDFIGSTISLAAANATSREEDRHAVGPMISAGALGSTRPGI